MQVALCLLLYLVLEGIWLVAVASTSGEQSCSEPAYFVAIRVLCFCIPCGNQWTHSVLLHCAVPASGVRFSHVFANDIPNCISGVGHTASSQCSEPMHKRATSGSQLNCAFHLCMHAGCATSAVSGCVLYYFHCRASTRCGYPES